MAEGMTGDKEAFHPDAADLKGLAVLKENLLISDRDLGQFVETVDHPAANLPRQITVFHFADVQLCISKQPGAVRLHCAHAVGIDG